jgi:serine/threonine protein kinase/tetratricopeptide (TPR) repeat protein
MTLPIGTVLDGKFKIVQILGEGGMGTVYKVEQLGTPPGMPPYYYAVKELLISSNTSEEDRKSAIDRFNKEIALLRGLKHPHIAALMLPFQERGNYYFVMEFVPGTSLEKQLEKTNSPLPEEQVLKWMIQVCEALTYIHTRTPPIILRDLKPGNIMITPNNEVQLIDFGIARRFDPNKRTNTENLGTISYASPEHLGSITAPGQRRSSQNPGKLVQTDARSDIYSLGATMYHLLTNYEPDPIQTPAPGSILAKNPRLRTVQVGNQKICPVEQVIIKAMQQNPGQRFQTAEAMRMALQQCLPSQATPLNAFGSHTAGSGLGDRTHSVQIPMMSPNSTIVVQPTHSQIASSNGGLICPKCGFHNRPGAKFCKRDGHPLIQGVAIAPPQVRAQAARTPIQARPAQPIQARPARPVQSIQARPITNAFGSHTTSKDGGPNALHNATVQDPASESLRIGLQYLTSKDYPKAIECFTKAQQQGSPPYDVLYNLGRAYRQYGQSVRDNDKKQSTPGYVSMMKRAAEYFEEALRHKNDALDAYFQLGMCYRDLERSSYAITAFKKALAIDPQDPAIYYQLGLAAMEQRSYREAESYFQDGLKIKPDHPLILIAQGRLSIETKQIAPAIKVLRQATQEDPDLWEGWYELGRAHMKQKEWNFALSAFERARHITGYKFEIYHAMATCYLKINQKADAGHMVNEILQRDPHNAEAVRLKKLL